MGISRWGVSWRTKKIWKLKNICIGAISYLKNPIGFLHRQHELKKKYWMSFRDPAKYREKFVLYMDNDAKHVSVETLKRYSSCEIETGSPHSPDINLCENLWGIIKKKLKGNEFKNVDELKTRVKSIYDEISISAIQNWVDSIRYRYKRVLAIDGKHLIFLIIKIRVFYRCLIII